MAIGGFVLVFWENLITISPHNDLANNFYMSEENIPESSKQLSPLALELIAARFKALSEPVRLRLLNVLMAGERTVGQLVEASGSGQANVLKHLALLRDTGITEGRITEGRIIEGRTVLRNLF